jgi:drug/metabolite transporter (DMT)-like permease
VGASLPGTHSSARAYAGAIFAVVVWGASFIATKIGVRQVSPLTVMWLRFGIGVGALAVAVAARREFALPGRRDLLYFVGLGALGITLHQWLQATGLVTAQASTTSWIITATPLTMALVGRAVLGERLHLRQAVGIVLGTVGVLLVVSRGDWHALTRGAFGSIGDALVGVSTLTWALFSVYSRRGLRQHRSAPMMLYVMGSGWLLGTIPWALRGGPAELGRLTPDAWMGILFLGLFCSGFAYILWYDALRALPAANVGALLYIEPLVTMVVAAVVLGEAVTVGSIAGGAVILAGVRIATRPPAA